MPETGQVFTTSDPDEARQFGAQSLYGGHITPARSDHFQCTAQGARIGSIALGAVRFATPVTIEFAGLDDSYGVSLPSNGALAVSIGSHEFSATPQSAVVTGLIGELTATGWESPHDRLDHLKIERAALESELSRLLGVDAVGPVHFSHVLDVRSGPGAEWSHYARLMFDSFHDVDGLMQNSLFTTQLSRALMTGLLLAADHQFRDALQNPARPMPPTAIRRAVEFIDDNAARPITIADIASAVSVSVRTLNRGFSEHLGTTPGAYLIRVRLDGAHDELIRSNPAATSVARVAAAWGFFHYGRFASRYRATYGVLPSQTLRNR